MLKKISVFDLKTTRIPSAAEYLRPAEENSLPEDHHRNGMSPAFDVGVTLAQGE